MKIPTDLPKGAWEANGNLPLSGSPWNRSLCHFGKFPWEMPNVEPPEIVAGFAVVMSSFLLYLVEGMGSVKERTKIVTAEAENGHEFL